MGYWKGLLIGIIILSILGIILLSLENDTTGEVFWLETFGGALAIWIMGYSYFYNKKKEGRLEKDRLKGYKYECEKCGKKYKTLEESKKHKCPK